MNRKLIVLNLLLGAAAIYAGVRVRAEYLAAKTRKAAALGRKVNPPAPPKFAPLPAPPPVLPASYADIAQKMLFDKSRNSELPPPPPPPAPPPPKPVPPLPAYHGQMTLPGQGPIVILSVQGGAHQGVRIGDEIGPFRLTGATSRELVFEWDGKEIRKDVDELLDRSAASQAAAAPARTAAAPPPVLKSQIGPGAETGNERGERYCDPKDSYENGAVVDGYRKNVRSGPFGAICFWELIRK